MAAQLCESFPFDAIHASSKSVKEPFIVKVTTVHPYHISSKPTPNSSIGSSWEQSSDQVIWNLHNWTIPQQWFVGSAPLFDSDHLSLAYQCGTWWLQCYTWSNQLVHHVLEKLEGWHSGIVGLLASGPSLCPVGDWCGSPRLGSDAWEHCTCQVDHAIDVSKFEGKGNQHHWYWKVEKSMSMHPICFHGQCFHRHQEWVVGLAPLVVSILATTPCSESLVAGNGAGVTKIHWCRVVSVIFHLSTKVPWYARDASKHSTEAEWIQNRSVGNVPCHSNLVLQPPWLGSAKPAPNNCCWHSSSIHCCWHIVSGLSTMLMDALGKRTAL